MLCEDFVNDMNKPLYRSSLESNFANNCQHAEALADRLLVDHPELGKKVRRALLCSRDDARRAITEAIKFVWLAAITSEGRLTPSHRVDLAWHELILFTFVYHEFCHQQFGKFVHHHPGDSHQVNRQPFANTLRCYRETFGHPPQDYWGNFGGHSVTCGNCESA